MNFIKELEWRGMIQDMTPGLEEELQKGNAKAYIGYDPTASSLTIGNLVTIMLLKHLQLNGHTPIVLMGGATGKIGDPSGKDAERKLLDFDIIDRNIEKFKKQFKKFLDFEGENAALILNNESFYSDMDVFTFLRKIGKNITVNYMMAKESVKNRIENRDQGISFTEFSYQIIQGYDFQYLFENEDCILQMGGSDQWGNIITGTHFVGKAGGKAFGLTCPLLTKSDGSKFGKSEGGNIWLDAEKTSPYQFYQFWINSVNNEDIPKMFKTFSLKSRSEIEELLEEYHENNPQHLLRVLAEELTIRVHSHEVYESVLKITEIMHNKKLHLDFLHNLSKEAYEMLGKEPNTLLFNSKEKMQDEDELTIGELLTSKGLPLDDFLVAGKVKDNGQKKINSKSDVRRAIKGNALSINTIKAKEHNQLITKNDLLHNRYIFIQNGKKDKFIAIIN
ncbi:MAG: tyrosine--tRNA ligase [Saprospiraceae bacterium]|nr:tyrosine--tRNA ligase [Saprospiraceae bacterium]